MKSLRVVMVFIPVSSLQALVATVALSIKCAQVSRFCLIWRQDRSLCQMRRLWQRYRPPRRRALASAGAELRLANGVALIGKCEDEAAILCSW